MPLYRFCRPEDIPMIVQALNTCYDVHFPQHPAMTVAQFREEMGLISLWPSNTMVVLENNDPIAVIVGTKRPYGCWIAKLGVALGAPATGHRTLHRRGADTQVVHHRPTRHQRGCAGGQ